MRNYSNHRGNEKPARDVGGTGETADINIDNDIRFVNVQVVLWLGGVVLVARGIWRVDYVV